MREYSVNEIILVPRGTELNRGLNEDSDSIVLDSSEPVVVLGPVADGAVEVLLPSHRDIQPLYFHQPEPRVSLALSRSFDIEDRAVYNYGV